MLKATLKGRATTLSKTLLTAGLLGGAALSTLGAGSAQAAWDLHEPLGYICTVGGTVACVFDGTDPTPTPVPRPNGDKILTLLGQTGLLSGDTIAFTKQPSHWEVALDFTTDIAAGGSGNLDYKIEITDPAYFFDTAELTASIGTTAPPTPAGPYTLTKKFYTDDTFVNEITSWGLTHPTNTLGAIGGQTIYVRDNWSVPVDSTASINNIDNNYTQTDVPAPLPLLGVAAAFGSLRKLRKFSSQLKTFSMG